MDKGHLGAMRSFSWRVIDQAEPSGASASHRLPDVQDLKGQVMDPFPPCGEEPV